MKTIQIVSLTLLTGFILFTSCKKEEMENVPQSTELAGLKSVNPKPPITAVMDWTDHFISASSLATRWNLYGTPKPQFVSFACNRFGLFDNNGRNSDGNYATSKAKVGNGGGYTIESDVCISITNTKGTIVSPEIGLTRQISQPSDPGTAEAGISMKLMYVGTELSGVPAEYQNQTYIVMTSLLEDGKIASSSYDNGNLTVFGDYAFKADNVTSGWHKMKFVVSASRHVSFYLDGQFIWSPKKAIDASLLTGKNVLIGFLSPGNGGKAYHDFVKVTYPVPDQPGSISTDESSER